VLATWHENSGGAGWQPLTVMLATDQAVVVVPMQNSAVLESARRRIISLDILRGLVIVIMVLDHVRDFLHISAYDFDALDPQRTTALLYTTRWVTHFCAPTFVFLAGVSAWLQHARGKSRRELSLFLLQRGLWLVVLEVTVLGFGWSFSLPFMLFLQVIWAIGWSLAALAALVWLPRLGVLAIGATIIVGHNLLDPIAPAQLGSFADLWTAVHAPGLLLFRGVPYALDLYPLLPWFGVLAFGYGLGQVFLAPPATRDRLLVSLGLAMIAAFLVLRFLNAYGNPQPWSPQADLGKSVMAFLNVQKYPPSLMYICATLGPVLTLVPLIERWRGMWARVFLTFGSVPLFFYVIHVYVAHALSIGLRVATHQSLAGQFDQLRTLVLHPQAFHGSGFSLPVVYVAWIAILAVLYPLCRWFAGVKERRRDWWLSYL
jgi:uncharacterized membrane protein